MATRLGANVLHFQPQKQSGSEKYTAFPNPNGRHSPVCGQSMCALPHAQRASDHGLLRAFSHELLLLFEFLRLELQKGWSAEDSRRWACKTILQFCGPCPR
eukprot:scaffold7175_cov14-Tisochrysis_lutea.AAC.1